MKCQVDSCQDARVEGDVLCPRHIKMREAHTQALRDLAASMAKDPPGNAKDPQ